jgi:hypothetical protein
VNGEYLVELGLGGRLKRAVEGGAGVVDQDVEPAIGQFLAKRVGERAEGGDVGRVER